MPGIRKIGINTSISGMDSGGGVSYSAEYNAVYVAMTNKPSEAVAGYQNTLVSTLVSGGQWAKSDQFMLFANESNAGGEASINWKNPGTLNGTEVGTLSFTSLQGLTGPGTATNWFNTNFIPSTHAVNTSQNNMTMFLFLRTVDATNHGFGSFKTQRFLALRSGTSFYTGVNGAGWNAKTWDTAVGLNAFGRRTATTKFLYKNKVETETTGDNSAGLSTIELGIFAYVQSTGIPTSYGNFECAAYGLGAYTKADLDSIEDAIETYLDANGKGVL